MEHPLHHVLMLLSSGCLLALTAFGETDGHAATAQLAASIESTTSVNIFATDSSLGMHQMA